MRREVIHQRDTRGRFHSSFFEGSVTFVLRYQRSDIKAPPYAESEYIKVIVLAIVLPLVVRVFLSYALPFYSSCYPRFNASFFIAIYIV